MNFLACRMIYVLSVTWLLLWAPQISLAESFWSSVQLPVPTRPADRQYLGVTQGDMFTPEQIDAHLVIIQIYSMYCPICQREATRVNQLYEEILKRRRLNAATRLIGIGAGNSGFEVDFYRTTYKVPFPLFADGDFTIHKLTGEVGTPYYYILKRRDDGSLDLVFSKSGQFESTAAFLQIITAQLE